MLTKAKSLYQVKLILDYLPEEEYKLIPQETIDYIEENFEYDENITINPNIPLENQRIDDKTYEFLDKVLSKVENTESKNNASRSVEEYTASIKKENEKFNDKMEIIRLNQVIEKIKKENSIIPKAKMLLEEYQQLLNQKNEQIIKLEEHNKYLDEYIQEIPTFIRKIFTKEENIKLIKDK